MAPESASSGDLTAQILQALSSQELVLSAEAFPKAQFAELKASLDRLASRDMVAYKAIDREDYLLEKEGEQIAHHGSHEARVFETLRKHVEGLTIAGLGEAIGDKTVTKVGQGKAFKEGWIAKTKDGKVVAKVRLIS